MIEIWKDIPGYEHLYQVSNYGKVMRLAHGNKREKLLKQSVVTHGYFAVHLFKNKIKKQIAVHRIVALTFLDNPERKQQVNHKDGNKQNNNVENLEWVTAYENIHHAIDLKYEKYKNRIADIYKEEK